MNKLDKISISLENLEKRLGIIEEENYKLKLQNKILFQQNSKSLKNIKMLRKWLGQINARGIGLNQEELSNITSKRNKKIIGLFEDIRYLKKVTSSLHADFIILQSLLTYYGYEDVTGKTEESLLEEEEPYNDIPENKAIVPFGVQNWNQNQNWRNQFLSDKKEKKVIPEIHIDLFEFPYKKKGGSK